MARFRRSQAKFILCQSATYAHGVQFGSLGLQNKPRTESVGLGKPNLLPLSCTYRIFFMPREESCGNFLLHFSCSTTMIYIFLLQTLFDRTMTWFYRMVCHIVSEAARLFTAAEANLR